ncbi:hypothetical protein EPN83_01425 [Patescibacteria group bacterium]|nr:MAG: hypothetical protein EPN83_01425 [Patescibacteria group bacterium]
MYKRDIVVITARSLQGSSERRSPQELFAIRSLYESGQYTLEELGDLLGGLSRERVRQLVRKTGSVYSKPNWPKDPLPAIRTLRENSEITSLHAWQKALKRKGRGGVKNFSLRKMMLEFGITEAVERLFSLRRWRNQALRREVMREDLRVLALKLGHTPSEREIDELGKFWAEDYYSSFGSLRAAQTAAGLKPNRKGGEHKCEPLTEE